MGASEINERDFALGELKKHGQSLEAVYVNLGRLQYLVKENTPVIHVRTIEVLDDLLHREEHINRRTSYFTYRKAADVLALALEKSPDALVRQHALACLRGLVCVKHGSVHRAVAESLGSLPLDIRGPLLQVPEGNSPLPLASWEMILELAGFVSDEPPRAQGRSLVLRAKEDQVLVIKMARVGDSAQALHAEASWMERLEQEAAGFPVDFHVPKPLRIDGSHVFRLGDLPALEGQPEALHPQRFAMAYVAHGDYFTYPNDPSGKGLPTGGEFVEILAKNAWLLGKLGAGGMVHTAPIPLFHNRVQAGRRTDQGIYEWPRQGRLDQWLFSCQYPNLCSTGLRDFEHILAFDGSMGELYLHMGTHVLSLVLVAGSYFRNKDPKRVGFSPEGKPVDARDLFDRPLLIQAIRTIFFRYYQGFVGREFTGTLPRDAEALADAMIREMGVDQHMEEVLRIHDQEAMTQEDFIRFLKGRGFSLEKAQSHTRGKGDIILLTGPHLGGFNDTISLPELICFVATVTSLCVSGRYVENNPQKAA
ncbi:MAG: SidJ-related pseudokinase [Desulfatibacillum sp.]|nr:SidJ-related pseudokinase [Desulfatibacillum sp.]